MEDTQFSVYGVGCTRRKSREDRTIARCWRGRIPAGGLVDPMSHKST